MKRPSWNQLEGLGERCKLPQLEERCKLPNGVLGEAPDDIDFGVFWEGKNSPDSNYYKDFYAEICSFNKIPLPKFFGAFVPNGR